MWFWLPAILLLCGIGCLVDSAFNVTVYGVGWGNRQIELIHTGGTIEVVSYRERHLPSLGTRLLENRRSRREVGMEPGITRWFLPRTESSGPDNPTTTDYWRIQVPHLWLITAYLICWGGIHVVWQRRKTRLLKASAAVPPP